jgi:hypothetical protein
MAARLGRVESALRDTNAAIDDLGAPDEPQLALHLAACRLLDGGLIVGAGRPAGALPPLGAALAHFAATQATAPKIAWVHVELGRALAALGRCEQARPRLASLDTSASGGSPRHIA